MSWKDELRKAPFGTRRAGRQMARESRENVKMEKERALRELDTHLIQNMDQKLKNLMREDTQANARGQPSPNRGHYEISIPYINVKIEKLVKSGMSEEQIQEYIRKKYKAEFVTLGIPKDTIEIKVKGKFY